MGDFSWLYDNDPQIIHKRKIDSGAFGDVHEVCSFYSLSNGELSNRVTRQVYPLPRSNLMASKVFARKVLRLGAFLSEEEIQNEIRVVNKLCLESVAHENVVAVYRHGNLVNSPAVYFFDMELCEFNLETYIPHLWEPTSLEKLTLVDQSPLIVKLESRIKYIWAIMCQIAKGVAFIHQQKEVHRDLKPRNGNSLLIST